MTAVPRPASDGYAITTSEHPNERRPWRATVVEKATGRVVGTTGFCESHARAYTGGIELAKADRRSGGYFADSAAGVMSPLVGCLACRAAPGCCTCAEQGCDAESAS